MKTTDIEHLLEKFYEGNTSLADEQTLREYFTKGEVADHLKSHQPYFLMQQHDQQGTLEDVNFAMMNNVRMTTKPDQRYEAGRNFFSRNLMLTASVAASILLLAGLFFTLRLDYSGKNAESAILASHQEIYADASKALLLVSCNLNNGIEKVERLRMLDKAMQNMQQFNKFYQVQTLISNQDPATGGSVKTK